MFENEQRAIEATIQTFCAANGIALAALEWKPIPFSGEWGISTSFFATAAAEKHTQVEKLSWGSEPRKSPNKSGVR